MFERYTDRARKVMTLAGDQAQRLNHECVGTEHILLALVEQGTGVGVTVLKNMDVNLEQVRAVTEKLARGGDQSADPQNGPQPQQTRNVIGYATQEARNLGHNYLGTEHLLLGLFRESEGVAARVLAGLGITVEAARAELLRLFGTGTPATAPSPASGARAPSLFLATRHRAEEFAAELGNIRLNTGHVLLALLREPDSTAVCGLLAAGVDLKALEAELLKLLQSDADKP